jgi:toxin CcdB
MPQFDIYPNPNPSLAAEIPYLLNLQVDFLGSLATRVVAPLARPSSGLRSTRHLNPVVTVAGDQLVLLVDQLAAVEARHLPSPVASLAQCRDEIIAALDFLFTGI